LGKSVAADLSVFFHLAWQNGIPNGIEAFCFCELKFDRQKPGYWVEYIKTRVGKAKPDWLARSKVPGNGMRLEYNTLSVHKNQYQAIVQAIMLGLHPLVKKEVLEKHIQHISSRT
jgi:hypothetical protein